MHRGSIDERIDVNYWRTSEAFEQLYANPSFSLAPLRELVALVQYGISERATVEPVGTPILRMNNLQADGWDLTNLKYVELNDVVKERFLLEPGDLLFNRTNSKELVGKCNVFSEPGEWVFASYLVRARLDEDRALLTFVSDFLNTSAGRFQIDRVSRQIIGMSNVNAEELQNLLIPLPPVATQRTFVTEMDAARASRNQKLAQADELLNSLDGWLLEQIGLTPPPDDHQKIFGRRLEDMFKAGRLDPSYHLPKHKKVEDSYDKSLFPIKTLQTVCEPPVGGATPRKGGAGLYSEESEGVRFLRILNVKPNELDLSDVNYISQAVHYGELARSQLAENDVLMTITGRVGTAAVVTKDVLPANINQHIVRLRVKDSECLPDYLSAYLNSSIGLD